MPPEKISPKTEWESAETFSARPPVRLPQMKSCLWAALSGVLLALSFPNFNFFPLAWLAPGLILLCAAERPKTFWIGFCAGLGHYLISLHWLLFNPIRLYGIASWLAVCGILAAFLGLWCWFCHRFRPFSLGSNVKLASEPNWKMIFWPLLCAMAWVTLEMTIARFLTGFPWNLLGASQHPFLPLIQMASITGIYGIGFLIVWISTATVFNFAALRRKEQTGKRLALNLASPFCALFAVLAFGWTQLSQRSTSQTYLKVALIQPAIPQPVIWDPAQETNRFHQLIELSKEALALKPHIAVWPEAALPRMLSRVNATAVSAIAELARTHQTWIILGATDIGLVRNDGNVQGTNWLNSVFLVDPNGELASRYFKRHLVPVGEYMPLREWIPQLDTLRKSGRSMTAGKNPVTFRLNHPDVFAPEIRISGSICFEDVFPHVTRLEENEKCHFLFNLTNDGWFGSGAAQWQHAASAAFRAIENGIPLVRCANNGISCWFDAQGRWHEAAFPDGRSVYASGFKLAKIPFYPEPPPPTFYRRFGDWFGWGCVAVVFLFWKRQKAKAAPFAGSRLAQM